jgi:hypothetical protein
VGLMANYRSAAEVSAQVAAQSQSDGTNATISKSPLVSGAAACWSEGLEHDAFCLRLAQCMVGAVLLSTASSSCVAWPSRREDLGEQVSIVLTTRGVSVPSRSAIRPRRSSPTVSCTFRSCERAVLADQRRQWAEEE